MSEKQLDAYNESLEVLARCRKYASLAQIDATTSISQGVPCAAPSVVIRGQTIELDRKSIRVLLDWQALGQNERDAFARAIAARARSARD